MTEDRFEEFLREAARDYNEPPAPPREAMWSAIQSARAKRPGERELEREARPWLAWGMGIAAVLALGIGLGIGIGRLSVSGPSAIASGEMPGEANGNGSRVFQVAAAEYLGRTDAFLSLFRSEAEFGGADAQVSRWARDLLSTARLMIDSPVADDPQLKTLLEDLELILAQIAQYSPDQGGDELELIEDGIEERGVLLRMRAVIAAQPGNMPAQGEL
jgi:hypothetical protein